MTDARQRVSSCRVFRTGITAPINSPKKTIYILAQNCQTFYNKTGRSPVAFFRPGGLSSGSSKKSYKRRPHVVQRSAPMPQHLYILIFSYLPVRARDRLILIFLFLSFLLFFRSLPVEEENEKEQLERNTNKKVPAAGSTRSLNTSLYAQKKLLRLSPMRWRLAPLPPPHCPADKAKWKILSTL